MLIGLVVRKPGGRGGSWQLTLRRLTVAVCAVAVAVTVVGGAWAARPASVVAADLGTLGGSNSQAIAVTPFGQVAGSSEIASGENHAFSWTRSGGMIDLGTLGGSFSGALAMNSSGQVVGNSVTTSENHAFSWTRAGGMIDLGTLGGSFSQAVGVSEFGDVVGTSTIDHQIPDTRHAYSWSAAGGMIDLGTLGGNFSDALAVSPIGQVVGRANIAGNAETHAFSWTR